MIKDISFNGLTQSPSDHNCTDGDLATCLNLIPEDGTLKPIGQGVLTNKYRKDENGNLIPDGVLSLPDETYSIIYVHKVTHDNDIHSHYIVHQKDEDNAIDKWYWMERYGDGTLNEFSLDGFKVNSVSAVGNILCFVGDDDTKFSFWKGSEYRMFARADFAYSFSIDQNYDRRSSQKTIVAEMGDEFWNSLVYNNHNSSGNESAYTINRITDDGLKKVFASLDANAAKDLDDTFFYDTRFGVIAFKLYDGSYFAISNPFILHPNQNSANLGCRADKIQGGASDYDNKEKFFSRLYSYYTVKLNIQANIEPIKDFIIGISVFITNNDTLLNLEKGYTFTPTDKYTPTGSTNHGDELYFRRSGYFTIDKLKGEALRNKIDSLTYYQAAVISKEQLYDGEVTINIKRPSLTKESLPLEDFYRNSIGGQDVICYNNRLHIIRPQTAWKNLFSFYPKYIFHPYITHHDAVTDKTLVVFKQWEEAALDITPITYSDFTNETVSNGETVKAVIEIININGTRFCGEIQYPLPPFFAIPIADIAQTNLYFKLPKNQVHIYQYYKRSLDFFSSQTFGMSYFLNSNESGDLIAIQPFDYKINGDSYYTSMNADYDFVKEEDFEKIHSLEKTRISSNPSLIKVSEAENPLVFPAKNSVLVGSSVVNALATNTQPITEGQFGDAPLYAFTDEGTWMLMLNQEGTYSARQPVNRDICSNPSGILQIDNAVLFPTERGIVLQQGKTSELITEPLDGNAFNFLQIYKENIQQKVIDVNKTSASDITYIPFREFMKGADMVYDYYAGRIIVYNPDQTYAYVYSLRSKMWGMMHSNLKKRVNIYPEAYAINKDNNIVDLYQSQLTEETPYFLCTRPFGLDNAEAFKTIYAQITRGFFRNQKGKCGMVLYGSNDLFRWYLIHSSVDKYLRGMCGSPYKYFRLALVGKLAPDESLSGFSTEYKIRWNNKLR